MVKGNGERRGMTSPFDVGFDLIQVKGDRMRDVHEVKTVQVVGGECLIMIVFCKLKIIGVW